MKTDKIGVDYSKMSDLHLLRICMVW